LGEGVLKTLGKIINAERGKWESGLGEELGGPAIGRRWGKKMLENLGRPKPELILAKSNARREGHARARKGGVESAWAVLRGGVKRSKGELFKTFPWMKIK